MTCPDSELGRGPRLEGIPVLPGGPGRPSPDVAAGSPRRCMKPTPPDFWPELFPDQRGPGASLALLPASACPSKFGPFPGQTPLCLEPKARRKSRGLGICQVIRGASGSPQLPTLPHGPLGRPPARQLPLWLPRWQMGRPRPGDTFPSTLCSADRLAGQLWPWGPQGQPLLGDTQQ